MTTIDALLEGKQLGTVKVTRPGWGDNWFRPCYVTAPDSGKQWWYGLRENGRSACYIASEAGWELWQEPVATRCEDCERLKKERDEAAQDVSMYIKDLNSYDDDWMYWLKEALKRLETVE